jgi:hypothetical protein
MWRPPEATPCCAIDFVSTGDRDRVDQALHAAAEAWLHPAIEKHSKENIALRRTAAFASAKRRSYENVAAEFRAAERQRLDLPNKKLKMLGSLLRREARSSRPFVNCDVSCNPDHLRAMAICATPWTELNLNKIATKD